MLFEPCFMGRMATIHGYETPGCHSRSISVCGPIRRPSEGSWSTTADPPGSKSSDGQDGQEGWRFPQNSGDFPNKKGPQKTDDSPPKKDCQRVGRFPRKIRGDSIFIIRCWKMGFSMTCSPSEPQLDYPTWDNGPGASTIGSLGP